MTFIPLIVFTFAALEAVAAFGFHLQMRASIIEYSARYFKALRARNARDAFVIVALFTLVLGIAMTAYLAMAAG